MRILTFTSLFPNSRQPDLAIFVYRRTVHLAQRPGNSVVVIAPIPYFPTWLPVSRWRVFQEIPREEMVGELRVLHPRYPFLPKIVMPLHAFLMTLGCLLSVRRLKKEFAFDCIDAHFVYPDGLAAVLLGQIFGIPVIVSARGTDINEYPRLRLIRPLIRWALRHATGVIAVSAALRDRIAELGCPPASVRVIPNGTDPTFFRPMDRLEARQSLGLPSKAQIVVCVAALRPVKGQDLLIKAMALLAPVHPGLQVYFVGDGPLRGELERTVSRLNLAEQVHFAGQKSNQELGMWFNAADVSCLTSFKEGWPNVVSEALACGTPVVATRVGGIPEILDSPELGILVDTNKESIAGGLEKALATSWNREQITARAAKRTWRAVAEEVETYLGECAERWKADRR
jgi:teichuronic acid biosynthesis glycosyltransferase TuaC